MFILNYFKFRHSTELNFDGAKLQSTKSSKLTLKQPHMMNVKFGIRNMSIIGASQSVFLCVRVYYQSPKNSNVRYLGLIYLGSDCCLLWEVIFFCKGSNGLNLRLI